MRYLTLKEVKHVLIICLKIQILCEIFTVAVVTATQESGIQSVKLNIDCSLNLFQVLFPLL